MAINQIGQLISTQIRRASSQLPINIVADFGQSHARIYRRTSRNDPSACVQRNHGLDALRIAARGGTPFCERATLIQAAACTPLSMRSAFLSSKGVPGG